MQGSSTKNEKKDDECDNNAKSIINDFKGLIICLKPEDDVSHPRHLCFKYPFNKTSPKRHCPKCYCYVCEEIAPCKAWNKPTQKHCQATERDEKWKLLRQLLKKLPRTTLTMAHHKLTITVVFEPPGQFVRGFAGGLISNDSGEWMSGFSMRFHNNICAEDSSFTLYTALVEGLKLSWAQGFRYLDVHLGILYRDGFWHDFNKDAKFHLSVSASSVSCHRIWAVMKEVDDYLNRQWFIDVVKCRSFKDETGPFLLAVKTDCQAGAKKVFDFTTYRHTAHMMDVARYLATNASSYYALFSH